MSNMVLTVRVKPRQREAFSSYLLRLTKANGISLLSLLNDIKKSQYRYIQRTDIGLLDFAPNSLIDITLLANLINIHVVFAACSYVAISRALAFLFVVGKAKKEPSALLTIV